ncbi:MAG: chromosome partitioning protein ParB [bacterium]|nr:chromosome partitioning protein ParB [bacterium]
MTRDTELSSLDLRYECYRMKNPAIEVKLLASIHERGIDEPLEGVDVEGKAILLNGFKRYRCARKLGMEIVPYVSLGEDEAAGIVAVLRASNNRSLTLLEQAHFLDDLLRLHRMTTAEIAETLARSKSWVSMRVGLFGEMSGKIAEKVFSGAFPAYAYMYTLRPFMRMNGIPKQDVEAFVEAVSGKKLSLREIEQLAHGYFRGPEWFRQEVDRGHLTLVLEKMNQVPPPAEGCNEFERVLLKDLEIVQKYLARVLSKGQSKKIENRAFHAQAHFLLGGILSRFSAFRKALGELHDRTAKA